MINNATGRAMTDDRLAPVRAIDVELVLLTSNGETLRYRMRRFPLPGGVTPDEAALSASIEDSGAPPTVCHSTSWRYEAPGALVLTYAALPGPDHVATGELLEAPAVLSSGDPLRPTPPEVHDHHVVAHAIRHLALLAREDPTVRAVASADPRTWNAIIATAERMPTDTHTAAHAAAAGLAADSTAGLSEACLPDIPTTGPHHLHRRELPIGSIPAG